MSIFEKRTYYKPFAYPEVLQFIEAINKSFWVHSEVDFTADVQDFHSQLSAAEQNAVKNSLLAIAQIEVNVKTFWGQLYTYLPHPELNGLGATFAECEFRHSEAYSRLLDVLGYHNEFKKVVEVPVIRERIAYLTRSLSYKDTAFHKDYVLSLILFSLLIENVSLFSQFAIILSFTHFRGLMKNVSNIIAWTSIDEQIHANAGIFLIQTIRKEHPELLDKDSEQIIYQTIRDSVHTEQRILEWIFEKGAIPNVSERQLLQFMQHRVDESLQQIGLDEIYHVTKQEYEPMKWFEEDVFANSLDDFFAKRPTEYTKHDKSITGADLF